MNNENEQILVKGGVGITASLFADISMEDIETFVEIGVQITIGIVTLISFLRNKKTH